MRRALKAVTWSLLLLACPAVPAAGENTYDPPALLLTWQRDPAHTMCIHWQTEEEAKTEVHWRLSGSTNQWQKTRGTSHPLPYSLRTVHLVELAGLRPATDYEFCFLPGERSFRFRTMPEKMDQPVRFIEGGDVYHERKWMDGMNALAGKFNPAFVVIGGDLAYALGGTAKVEQMERWNAFFDSWKKNARTPDGRLLPMIVTIGNHEVAGHEGKTPAAAKVFYSVFPLPGQQGYARLDFGDYLSLFLLDSSHTHPIPGAQTKWLNKAMAERQAVPHLIPIYHVPAFPSYRSETPLNLAIRTNWCPIFERNGVRVAFEHHDHTYKRTHPIKNGKIDPEGIVYLGDGAWGVNLRGPESKAPRWYMARCGEIRHFWMVTLTPEGRHMVAVNESGQFFDEVYQPVDNRERSDIAQ